MAKLTISISAAIVVIAAAAALSATAGGAGAPSPGAIEMPGCETSCGNVSMPYPFGIGPSYCYHSPGFKLTCDESSDPPRLLLGEDNTFRVVEISLSSSTVRVVRTGAILNGTFQGQEVTSHAVFSVPGGEHSPYFLSSGNELVVTGCNAVEVLIHGGAVDNNAVSAHPSLCGLYAPTRAFSGDKC